MDIKLLMLLLLLTSCVNHNVAPEQEGCFKGTSNSTGEVVVYGCGTKTAYDNSREHAPAIYLHDLQFIPKASGCSECF